MRSIIIAIIFTCGITSIFANFNAYGGYKELEVAHKEWEEMWLKVLSEIKNSPEYAADFARKLDIYETEEKRAIDIPFECDVELSESRPTSVHRLRPSDIQIVGALGDSITAAFALRAQSLPAIIYTNRGESWSIGSDRTLDHGVITLPNILRKFNPNLQGSSICNRYPIHPYMNWFNVAIGGTTSLQMPFQARNLVDRLRADETIDFFNDWKLITLLIGGNDLCRFCFNNNFLPPNYAASIKEALDIMQDHIPRAMVNLVVMLDVTVINHVNHSNWCSNIHSNVCPCALGEHRETASRFKDEYYYELKKIVDSGRYDQWDDFTVVLQPQMRDLYPDVLLADGKLPQDYFAPDCFHPAQRGHQDLAVLLWSAMMTPVGEKPYKFFPEDLLDGYKCPSKERPYIFTNLNSFEEPVTAGESSVRVTSALISLVLAFIVTVC